MLKNVSTITPGTSPMFIKTSLRTHIHTCPLQCVLQSIKVILVRWIYYNSPQFTSTSLRCDVYPWCHNCRLSKHNLIAGDNRQNMAKRSPFVKYITYPRSHVFFTPPDKYPCKYRYLAASLPITPNQFDELNNIKKLVCLNLVLPTTADGTWCDAILMASTTEETEWYSHDSLFNKHVSLSFKRKLVSGNKLLQKPLNITIIERGRLPFIEIIQHNTMDM